jgi:hypothetical protein
VVGPVGATEPTGAPPVGAQVEPVGTLPGQVPPAGAPQPQGVQDRESRVAFQVVCFTAQVPPGQGRSPSWNTQAEDAKGAGGRWRQRCAPAHSPVTPASPHAFVTSVRGASIVGAPPDAGQLPPLGVGPAQASPVAGPQVQALQVAGV